MFDRYRIPRFLGQLTEVSSNGEKGGSKIIRRG